MGELNSAVGDISVLSASPGAAAGLPVEILVWNHQISLLGDREDGNRDGARLSSTLLFRRRDPLPAMTAGFVRKCRSSLLSTRLEDKEARLISQYFVAKDTSVPLTCCRS